MVMTNLQDKIDRFVAAEKAYTDWQPAEGGYFSPAYQDSMRDWEKIKAERLLGLDTGYGPEVGMLCTYHIGSDRYASRIIRVSPSGHQVWITDADQPIDNVLGKLFTRRADGSYRGKGGRHAYITFFHCSDYRDPSY
jgi:hypothetical protein